MRECEGYLSPTDFDRIIREVYGEIHSPISNTDSESSSSGFLGILMETLWYLIDKEVLSYDHSVIHDSYISKLHSNNSVSSTRNEEDVV